MRGSHGDRVAKRRKTEIDLFVVGFRNGFPALSFSSFLPFFRSATRKSAASSVARAFLPHRFPTNVPSEIQSATIAQSHGLVKSCCGSSPGRWPWAAAIVQS